MSDRKRLLIAFVLSMAVFIIWPLIMGPKAPPPAPNPEAAAPDTTQGATTPPPTTPTTPTPGDPAAPSPAPSLTTIAPITATLTTPDFSLTFTNLGARPLTHHILSPTRYQARGDLFSYLQSDQEALNPNLPYDLSLGSVAPDLKTTSPFALLPSAADAPPSVHFQWTSPDGMITVDKIYRPGDAPFAVKLELLVTNKGAAPLSDSLSLSLWGQQDPTREPSFFEPTSPVEAACFSDDDVERADRSDDPETFTDSVRWVAIDDTYFVYAASGEQWRQCELAGINKKMVRATLTRPLAVGANASTSLIFDLYLGPKEDTSLVAFGQSLDKTINFGWVEFLAKPLHWLLVKLFSLMQSWGLAIISLTLLIRGLLWPVTQRSQDSMMAMRELQPRIKELQEKYADNPLALQQQQLALFKEHNVNPFGCLPLFLQIPIWFALYRTIYSSAELYQSEFLWIKDLSVPDHLYILPAVVGVLFFAQQWLSGTTSDPKQKVIMYIMTGLFVVFMFLWPAGLNVYILVSTLVGLAQTVFSKRRHEALKRTRAAAAEDSLAAAALDTSSAGMAAAAAATPIGAGRAKSDKK
jgi:YidC/Oxa1 family membrane protein insertase